VLRGLRRPYPSLWLRRLMIVSGLACLTTYTAYCVSAGTVPADDAMLLTVPFVGLGLGRFAHLAGAIGSRSGPLITAAPEDSVIRDRPLLFCVAAWASLSVAAMYWIK